MSRRDFFSAIVFGFLALFIRRSTQAKLYLQSGVGEGRPIPHGLVISQVVGRGKPFYPQDPIPTQKLRSVLEFEPLDLGKVLPQSASAE